MLRMRDRLTFANVMSVTAVFIALGGSALAINKIKANGVGSKQIKAGAVKTDELGDNSVTSPKVANGSLLSEDFKAGQLPAGATGPQGPQGVQGLHGQAGSPDTGAQILSKLAPVDGNGSGLDADRLDGLTSTDFTDNFALRVADPVHVVTGVSTPAFQNSFTSGDPPHGVVGFFRDGFGVVHLQGTVKLPGAGFNNTVFTLPAGYRPEAARVFVAWRFGAGSVPKTPNGVAVDPSTGNLSMVNPAGADLLAANDEVNLDGITFRCAPSGANGCP